MLEDSEHSAQPPPAPQARPDEPPLYAAFPHQAAAAADEQQSLLFYSMLSNNAVPALPEEASSVVNLEAIWDYGLWNLEDFHGTNNTFGSACSTAAKSTVQNLVLPFC